MSQWTAERCFRQLDHVGVQLSLSDDGSLNVGLPSRIYNNAEYRSPMLRAIREYKPSLIRILQEQQEREQLPPALPPDSSTQQVPPEVRPTVDAVRKAFADVGTVSVARVDQKPEQGTEPEPVPETSPRAEKYGDPDHRLEILLAILERTYEEAILDRKPRGQALASACLALRAEVEKGDHCPCPGEPIPPDAKRIRTTEETRWWDSSSNSYIIIPTGTLGRLVEYPCSWPMRDHDLVGVVQLVAEDRGWVGRRWRAQRSHSSLVWLKGQIRFLERQQFEVLEESGLSACPSAGRGDLDPAEDLFDSGPRQDEESKEKDECPAHPGP